MTPEQKLKHMILNQAVHFGLPAPSEPITAANVDAIYEQAEEDEEDSLQDARNEIRQSGIRTGLPAQPSRHYESESVAAQAPDGTWIGWTYWFGGGKHGEPEAVDWMDEAYALSVTEEEKMTVVRTFEKLPA